jgi:hypothetical protein
MLLELHDVDRSLRSAGVALGISDKRIQPYPNRPALDVRIDQHGQIVSPREIPRDQLGAMRKFERSTGGLRESSPGFNVDPLFRLKSGDEAKYFQEQVRLARRKGAKLQPEERERLAEKAHLVCEANWDFSAKSKVSLCLKEAAWVLLKDLARALLAIPDEQLEKEAPRALLEQMGIEDARLKPLLEILRRSQTLSVEILHQRLGAALLQELVSGSGDVRTDDCLKMLFSSRDLAGNQKATNESFSLVLELADWNEWGGYPANHEAVWGAVNEHLVALQATELSGGACKASSSPGEERVGIFGETIRGPLGTMPERNLPRLGKVKLFSLADIPCQHRYGLIESDACPVGPEIQARLSSALQWITDKERENQTWADVSNSCGYNKQAAVLIAYADKMPATPLNLTGFFVSNESGAEESGPSAEALFAATTETVIQTLRGVVSDNPKLVISVLVIAKADTARKKLLYSRQFAAKRLIAAADEWQLAARNIPNIRIRNFDSSGKPQWISPRTPRPDGVVRVINTWWESNGEKPKRVSNARLGLGLALLLETGPTCLEAAREALRALVRSATPIVLALARSHIKGRVFPVPKTFREIPLLVPATLGLVLAKANHEKGAYMKSNSYLIGRLMNMADKFHRNYCQVVREGQFPPRLIGNALMPTALENPTAGLARLADRVLLYLSVAPVELRTAAADIERAIDKDALPGACNDEQKAQMLLGYLASVESADVQTIVPETTEETKS